jgi:hypothetical protein
MSPIGIIFLSKTAPEVWLVVVGTADVEVPPLAPPVGVLGGNEVIDCWLRDEVPVPVEADDGAVIVEVVADSVPERAREEVETWK